MTGVGCLQCTALLLLLTLLLLLLTLGLVVLQNRALLHRSRVQYLLVSS